MKLVFLILLFSCFLTQAWCQVSEAVPADSLAVYPNTVRVTGQIISTQEKTAVLKISKVIASGAGIINVLSEGQTITVQLRGNNSKLPVNQKIEADLREKVGIDAASSTYTMMRTRKLP